MNKLQEAKIKDQSCLKQNSSVLTNIMDKNHVSKRKVFPPNLKTAIGHKKGNQKEFKKVKSLSPIVYEQMDSRQSKVSVVLNSTILKIGLDCKNPQENENFPKNVEDLMKDMRVKVEDIEKKCGSSVSNQKIREFLLVFEEFSNFFHNFRFFLSKFKRLFEQIYLKNIILRSEVQELKDSLKKKEDFEKTNKDFLNFDENSLKKVSSEGILIKAGSDEKLNKVHRIRKQAYVSSLKDRVLENANWTQQKTEALCGKKENDEKVLNVGKVPKLSVNDKILDIQGFQDEFMQNFQDFSQSWRNLIEEQRRYE